jgi:hypothetical protein
MNIVTKENIKRNSIFAWIAIGAGLVLLIPVVAMQLTTEVNWGPVDFVVMGLLLFGTGSLFVLISRKTHRKYRAVTATVVSVSFLYIWAELAVGIFTNLGS